MTRRHLTQVEVRRLLCYNPLSGNFMWRKCVNQSKSHKIQPGDIAGSVWGTKRGRTPCRYIKIYGKRYGAHQLAFLYIKGYFPAGDIDHKDGDGLNNRWLNLRECNRSQNCANRGANKNNKLGIKGIHLKKNGKYHAQININFKKHHLGDFNTSEAAYFAYQKAAKKHFGEFASW